VEEQKKRIKRVGPGGRGMGLSAKLQTEPATEATTVLEFPTEFFSGAENLFFLSRQNTREN
jgi:hypothetical protein